jgi:hypothetical protein
MNINGDQMANYVFIKDVFNVNLSYLERRTLARTGLSLEKSRLVSADIAKFPEKLELGRKISKIVFLGGISGEYRSNNKKILVFGKPTASDLSLRIRVSHPNIDEIWVCGAKAVPLQKELQAFIMPRGAATSESN